MSGLYSAEMPPHQWTHVAPFRKKCRGTSISKSNEDQPIILYFNRNPIGRVIPQWNLHSVLWECRAKLPLNVVGVSLLIQVIVNARQPYFSTQTVIILIDSWFFNDNKIRSEICISWLEMEMDMMVIWIQYWFVFLQEFWLIFLFYFWFSSFWHET